MYVDILFPINAQSFTYLVPAELEPAIIKGCRVRAPFKKSNKVGIVVRIERNSTTGPRARGGKPITLKKITEVMDDEAFVPENLLKLVLWAGQYYLSSSGLALKNAVPAAFFTGKKAGKPRITYDSERRKNADFELNPEQKKALDEINSVQSGVFLLHGVTGSGKTAVYIEAIKSLPDDRQAIVLVPEIAITSQMIDRFRASFDSGVVFFHSGISVGERITQWKKIRSGEARVVIGVRSAVFAPFTNLGLIVIDEEQEASYKQFEGLRYNARDVALARAQIEDTKIVLGTATPSLEVYYNSQTGKFGYLKLTSRIDNKKLPPVKIIDMTKAEKESVSFSKELLDVLRKNISDGHQSLLMLNRRGYSPFFMCTDCGHTYKCPTCSITLIYHKDTNTLNCHYCNSHLNPQNLCPVCKGTNVKYLGAGTQRVEEELEKFLPELSLQRMDRDSTRKKLSHHRIIRQMEERKIDLLIGTQMVAKGHDFVDVTVSAVVSADVALNLPDFRSAERAFQLFTQLAGRAGRGDVSGRAYVQTHEPEHYVFDFVRGHDYEGFYRKEIELRKELSYPPFTKLIRVILSFRNKDDANRRVKSISNRIKKMNPSRTSDGKRSGIEVLGPAPAPIEKIKNLWRWHLVLKGKDAKQIRQMAVNIFDPLKNLKDVKIDIDVDPVNML
jgi:primosomal protein N' (replication factor Y)